MEREHLLYTWHFKNQLPTAIDVIIMTLEHSTECIVLPSVIKHSTKNIKLIPNPDHLHGTKSLLMLKKLEKKILSLEIYQKAWIVASEKSNNSDSSLRRISFSWRVRVNFNHNGYCTLVNENNNTMLKTDIMYNEGNSVYLKSRNFQ